MKLWCTVIVLCSFIVSAYAQAPETPQASEVVNPEIEALKKRVLELEEVQRESVEIQKRQLSDQFYDQSSRGFLEGKFGLSHFNPEDINDNNDDAFGETDDASWENFQKAYLFELEIGKTIANGLTSIHEVSIGYQHFRSKAQGDFEPDGGGDRIQVYETVSIHTMFLRYAHLFTMNETRNFFFGPGVGLGYSPVTEIQYKLEQDDEGIQMTGEGTSFLIEVFGKAKFQISRYFSLVSSAGYRMQEADNLRLNAADLVDIKTKTDLDASGLFATFGMAVAF